MNSRTVARNSVWYGLETGINMFLTLFTSIAIARAIGPAKLGYFIYVWYLVNAAASLGSLGIPAATRKYMSEYYGRGQSGIARSIFRRTLGLQAALASAITLIALVLVITSGDPAYRTVAVLMTASIFPVMINAIPAQANMAAEDMAANVPGSIVSTAIFVSAAFISIVTGSGLVGISIGLFTMRTAELFVRIIPVLRRLRAIRAQPIPDALRNRMLWFSGRSMVLLLLGLVVWDRSELIFLKMFCADIRQVAFYSVAFNLTERLLLISQVFGQATGSSIMAQYGRDQNRLPAMVSAAARYLALFSMPVHFGLAAVAGAVMLLAYGSEYTLAIPALTIAAVLGVFKAFFLPAQHLMESTENQNQLIKWGLVAGALNIILDFLLIPKFGAIGAAIANGTTQAFSVIALWTVASRLFGVKLPYVFLVRIALLAATMALAVHWAAAWMPPLACAAAGVTIGVLLYTILLRAFGRLSILDLKRLSQARHHIPNRMRNAFDFSLSFIAPVERV